jgi:hypothetical protein
MLNRGWGKPKLRRHGGCSGMRCCLRARRWWRDPFLWLCQGEGAAEVAVGEEVQWVPSVAFEPKKKGKTRGSNWAHGQERHGEAVQERGVRWSTAHGDGGGGRQSVDVGAHAGSWYGGLQWAGLRGTIQFLIYSKLLNKFELI